MIFGNVNAEATRKSVCRALIFKLALDMVLLEYVECNPALEINEVLRRHDSA